ncbi:MAG: hypothetical protein Q9177_004858 [Variospora cf. flavescens]
MNPKEVVVYCDISRYVERKDEDGKTLLYDPDINQAESEESLIKGGCGTPTSGAAMAFTVKQRETSKIQQIQICPWYMNYVASVEYKVARTNTLKGWFFRLLDAVQNSLAFFALAAEVWSQGVGMPQLDGSIRLHQQQAEGDQNEKRGGGFIGRMWRA